MKLTGKGAGSLSAVYSGCFVVDDAIKPKDAYSATVRTEINDRFDNTFMSRLANDGVIDVMEGGVTVQVKCGRTPMFVIMQRVHDDDLVGYLLRGKSSDVYKWLNVPALVHEDTGSEAFYQKIINKQAYTHVDPVYYELNRPSYPCALWPSRKSLESLLAMQENTPYTFNSQYLGNPTAKGTGVIQDDWWQEYLQGELPKEDIIETFLTGDTASTTKSYSDYSVLCWWGKTKDNNLYLLDFIVGKWEVPELKIEVEKFWAKCNVFDKEFPRMLPRALYMEDKQSGQFINQQLMREGNIRLLPVPRDKSGGDKFARFLSCVTYFAQGKLFFPTGHKHLNHAQREILGMTGLGSGTGHDDFADNVTDGCIIAFEKASANYASWV